jgi:hypothetical protein
MGTLVQDLRYAVRGLLRSPGFTAVAVATLALGIVVNTAVFSLLNVFFQPLPVRDPAAVVQLWRQRPGRDRVKRAATYAVAIRCVVYLGAPPWIRPSALR